VECRGPRGKKLEYQKVSHGVHREHGDQNPEIRRLTAEIAESAERRKKLVSQNRKTTPEGTRKRLKGPSGPSGPSGLGGRSGRTVAHSPFRRFAVSPIRPFAA